MRILPFVLVIITISVLSSCERCITCEVENEGFKVESTFCASGIGSKKELDDWEKSMKKENENVACTRTSGF
jgi:hypothetical protein